jgi:hypothetical protein
MPGGSGGGGDGGEDATMDGEEDVKVAPPPASIQQRLEVGGTCILYRCTPCHPPHTLPGARHIIHHICTGTRHCQHTLFITHCTVAHRVIRSMVYQRVSATSMMMHKSSYDVASNRYRALSMGG